MELVLLMDIYVDETISDSRLSVVMLVELKAREGLYIDT
jgi:hypothetical protein